MNYAIRNVIAYSYIVKGENPMNKPVWLQELTQGSWGAWTFNSVLWFVILLLRVVGYLDWDLIDAMTWEKAPVNIVLNLLFPLVLFILSVTRAVAQFRKAKQKK